VALSERQLDLFAEALIELGFYHRMESARRTADQFAPYLERMIAAGGDDGDG
jgi:hypothetical protein